MVERSFKEVVEVSKRLRKDCAWDHKETIDSFAKYLLEEAHEVLQSIEQKDYFSLREELGDLLWNVLFVINIADEKNLFTLKEVLEHVKEKMIRRHPHVYSDAPNDLESIHRTWLEIKEQENKIKHVQREEFYKRIAAKDSIAAANGVTRELVPLKPGEVRTRVVMFDYDGVLVNSFTLACLANELIANELRRLSLSENEEVYRDLFETNWKEALAKLGIVRTLDVQRAEEIYHTIVQRYRNSITLYPDVLELLKTLHERGYKLAIVSNNAEYLIRERLNQLDILKYFDLVLDHTHGVKPEIQQIVKCLHHFNAQPGEAVLIGDMDGDILAAKRAKLKRAIAVTYGYHPKHRLHLADVLVDSPLKILEVID